MIQNKHFRIVEIKYANDTSKFQVEYFNRRTINTKYNDLDQFLNDPKYNHCWCIYEQTKNNPVDTLEEANEIIKANTIIEQKIHMYNER